MEKKLLRRIVDLKPAAKKKAMKIYNAAFVEQPTPCPSCQETCCGGCESSVGYFYNLNDFQKAYTKYGWTNTGICKTLNKEKPGTFDQGFFVAGKGCRLPAEERALVCVGFTCGSMNAGQHRAGLLLYREMGGNHEVYQVPEIRDFLHKQFVKRKRCKPSTT